MCGITACVADDDVLDELLTGLGNLEYRGYDSSGIAVPRGDDDLTVVKRAGEIEALRRAVDETTPGGRIGIGHTRWSTHGPPTDENAHPHTDCTGAVSVVHNGIIENHESLRRELTQRGHSFTSDTDTEVIPHLVEEGLADGLTTAEAFRRAVDRLEGSFAVVLLVAGEGSLHATRRGSPLVLGLDGDRRFLASDVPSFLEYTDRVVHLEDGDVVEVGPDGYAVTDADGDPVARQRTTVDWMPEDATRGGYEHYMLKEINEQPTALERTIQGRIGDDGGVTLSSFPPGTFADVSQVQFVACGTSYHAALYAREHLVESGVPAYAFRAGEYATTPAPVDGRTLVVAVTQSGETADTLGAIQRASDMGAPVLTVTNVVGSSAAREADETLFIHAGPEIGVAATKTFSSQAVTLSLLAQHLAKHMESGTQFPDIEEALEAVQRLPSDMDRVIDTDDAAALAKRYIDSDAYFFIGRTLGHPVAKEAALKFKEITYEHAEGFASGELKHGPLALVTPNTPVFAIFTGRHDEKTLKNAKEAQTRGADVIAVAPEGHEAIAETDGHLPIPRTHPVWAGLLANVQLQLLSYHAADHLGRSIDKPRNLAKSVTVE